MMKIPNITKFDDLQVFLDNADYPSYEPISKELFNVWLTILLQHFQEDDVTDYHYSLGPCGHELLDDLYRFTLITNGFDLKETLHCTDVWYD